MQRPLLAQSGWSQMNVRYERKADKVMKKFQQPSLSYHDTDYSVSRTQADQEIKSQHPYNCADNNAPFRAFFFGHFRHL